MDWVRKHHERVALAAAAVILLLSGIWICYRAIRFTEQFATRQSRSPQLPAAPPGKATAVETAAQQLRQPPQWTFSGRSGLFVPEKHFIGADGQPATLHTTEVHPPVPNEWFEQFGLPIADGDVLEQDPDGDGFTNFDEWEAHTNPTDRNSHPGYVTKLKLKSFTQEPFRFVFASGTADAFGINTIDLKEPTQFVRIGDMVAGTPYRVSAFKEKFERNKYGTNVDVSELTLENIDTLEQVTLVKEKVAISPSSVATLVYTWKGRREFVVKKDQEFSLPPETDIKYKLIDVQPTKAVITSSQKPEAPIEIGLLAP